MGHRRAGRQPQIRAFAHRDIKPVDVLRGHVGLGADDALTEQLNAALEPASFGPLDYERVRAAAIPEVMAALSAWTVLAEAEQRAVAGARAEPGVATFAPAPSAEAWARDQQDRGRGVLLRGNPFDPSLGTLYLYASRYLDLVISDPVARPYVLTMPLHNGGWYLSYAKEHPADPLSPAAGSPSPRSRAIMVATGVAVLAFSVVILSRGQHGSH